MNHRLKGLAGKPLLGFILVHCLVLHFLVLHAASLDDLVARGEISTDIRLEVAENPLAKQELALVVTITTDHPFNQGTRLEIPEIRNGILVQRDAFAVNSTVTENGISHIVQQWELAFFPQLAGVFHIPPVIVEIGLIHPDGAVSGALTTQPLTIDVGYPPGKTGAEDWLAATNYRVERELLPADFRVKPGQVLQVRITQTAENLLAMMLPPFELPATEGLGIYRHAPKLVDNSQRGEKIAQRIDTFDLMVEKPGTFRLPPWQYDWWDTGEGAMKQAGLSALELSEQNAPAEVEAHPGDARSAESPQQARQNTWGYYLAAITAVLAAAAFALWRFFAANRLSPRPSTRRIRANIRYYARKKDARQCARWLYCWLDAHSTTDTHAMVSGQQKPGTLREFAGLFGDDLFATQVGELLRVTYGPGPGGVPDLPSQPFELKTPPVFSSCKRTRHPLKPDRESTTTSLEP